VRADIRQAKAEGAKSGKPCGRPKISSDIEAAIRKALAKGDKGMHKIAIELGVATGTVQPIKAEMAA
jgi:DNA invertase Pin-like site-specific DNA recombinase